MAAALFSPVLSTLDQALQAGFLLNFPGLSSKLLRKYPPQYIPMIKGHLDQRRQNQHSTKVKQPPPTQHQIRHQFIPHLRHWTRAYCYATVFEPTGQIYTDQTGRFVTPSTQGNKYLLLLYDYDSSVILAEPIKT